MRTKTKNGLGGLVPVIVATSFGFVVVQLDVTIVNEVARPHIELGEALVRTTLTTICGEWP